MESERVRRKYFRDLNRKAYIGRALEVIRSEGAEAISICRMAKKFQCNTTNMYRYSEDVEELPYYAGLRYLDEYLRELNVRGKEWRDVWDIHIDIWGYYCRIALRYPQTFDIILFSATGRGLTTTIYEYYDMFPERTDIVSPYLRVILQSTDPFKRGMVMTKRCTQADVITMGSTMNINQMVYLLYKGYLKEILDYGLGPDEIGDRVQEFKRDVEVIMDMYASDTLGHDYLTNTR